MGRRITRGFSVGATSLFGLGGGHIHKCNSLSFTLMFCAVVRIYVILQLLRVYLKEEKEEKGLCSTGNAHIPLVWLLNRSNP